jgi:hypothetical protein
MTRKQPIDISDARPKVEYQTRLREREVFETQVTAEASERVKTVVTSLLGTATSASRISAVQRNLIERLRTDSELVEQLAELQKLPVGEKSRGQRLAALERGVHRHLPAAMLEVLPELGAVCITSGLVHPGTASPGAGNPATTPTQK